MPSPKGDPLFIKDKERFFMDVAMTIAKASSHPYAPGGCVVVRDREIIGDGRSILTASEVEVDCITHAIATAAKRGTPTPGAEVYTTRYPFASAIFQCYVMGIRRLIVRAHPWEANYKYEFRKAARLARELCIAIEPIYDKSDPQLSPNANDREDYEEELFPQPATPYAPDEFDQKSTGTYDD
jgi:deoxycytidylate deaminase